MADEQAERTETTTEVTPPIIIDLGKKRPKGIRQLKQGTGKVWDEVYKVIDEVRSSLGREAVGKTILPVVLIYRKRKRRIGL